MSCRFFYEVDMDLKHFHKYVLDNETIEDLQNDGLYIIQKKDGFRFGIDAVLLSDFAKVKKGSHIIDIGTGTGIIPILMTAKTDACTFVGLEIQKEFADMAQRSVMMNNLDSVKIINGDIKKWEGLFSKASFDVITCNPPYMTGSAGLKNDSDSVTIARHEILCNLEDIIVACANVLKPKGSLYMIHRPGRVADIFECMRKHKIEPKMMRFVHSNYHSKPSMVMIKATRGGNAELIVERPLFVYDENGDYTDEVRDIYGGQ